MNTKYDSSFLNRDHETRERHGMLWEPWEHEELKRRFKAGQSLELICQLMKRPAAGVLSKLVQLKRLTQQIRDGRSEYFYADEQPDCVMDDGRILEFKTCAEPEEAVQYRAEHKRIIREARLAAQAEYQPTTIQGTPVTSNPHKTIETKTFIRGAEASSYTNDQIIHILAEQEAQLKFLQGLDAAKHSTAIAKKIDEIHLEIAQLIKYLDER